MSDRMQRVNDDDLLALYRTMTTADLLRLATAFWLDQAAGADTAFCAQRLIVVARVLEERGERDDG